MTDQHFYFDTSIWIDIYDERGQQGEIAKRLVEKIVIDDEVVLYSDVVMVELKKLGFSEYEINQMLSIAKPDHIRRVQSTKDQIEEAKSVAKQRDVPLRDALHAILSRDHEALFISRDWHFEKLKDITKTMKPEDLVQ